MLESATAARVDRVDRVASVGMDEHMRSRELLLGRIAGGMARWFCAVAIVAGDELCLHLRCGFGAGECRRSSVRSWRCAMARAVRRDVERGRERDVRHSPSEKPPRR